MAERLLLAKFSALLLAILVILVTPRSDIVSCLPSKDGISLPLIHKNALDMSNKLNQNDKFERLVLESKARFRSWLDADGDHDPSVPITRGDQNSYMYVVEIGIGSFDEGYKPYYLGLDISNQIIWTQCEGCTKCFPQRDPLFPKSLSKSYQPILCGHNPVCPQVVCSRTKSNYCLYHGLFYPFDPKSNGTLSTETFTFNDDRFTLIFGCGMENHIDNTNSSTMISGILGMSNGTFSLVSQLNTAYGLPRRYSYCLQPFTNNSSSKMELRLGESLDKYPKTALKASMFRPFDNMRGTLNLYVGKLSVNNKALVIGDALMGDRKFMLDTATVVTQLEKEAYQALKSELMNNLFANYSGLKQIPGQIGLDLCYEGTLKQGESLPTIAFGMVANVSSMSGDFVIKPESGFYQLGNNQFCLAMVENQYPFTILGAYQQTNKRIIFDIDGSHLRFMDQDC